MANVEFRLSKRESNEKSQIIIKLTINPHFRPCFKSGVYVKKEYFKPVKETTRGRIMRIVPPKDTLKLHLEYVDASRAKNELNVICSRMITICQVTEAKNIPITKKFIEDAMRVTADMPSGDISYNSINELIKKESSKTENKKSFFDLLNEFQEKSRKKDGTEKSDVWKKNFGVLKRALQRYQYFIKSTENKEFQLDIDNLTSDDLEHFESYFINEHSLCKEYPKLFNDEKIRPRGHNTICVLFDKLRAFCTWCVAQRYTTNMPFLSYKGLTTEKYGTPYYITIEERNFIAEFDLSAHPELSIQRDIFIFQCLVGCRVFDLLRFTSENITNGFLNYIPTKTKGERPITVSVPLNDRAKKLVDKYNGGDTLFPFVSAQKYNNDIKKIFTLCDVTRLVTILNPTTGKEEQRPINEIASSHLARRTFIGNIYKKVKDPNLICSLSGHKEGSRAFARYRDIDDETKREVISLID